jgi:hypothetical protein
MRSPKPVTPEEAMAVWSSISNPSARRVVRALSQSGRKVPVTAYLKNGGSLENAAAMANHASTRTTQLYDRRRDEMSLDEVERISI